MTLSLMSGLAVAISNLLLAPSLPAADAGDMVPLALKLPAPAFKGTPKDLQLGPNVEPLSDKPRPAAKSLAAIRTSPPTTWPS